MEQKMSELHDENLMQMESDLKGFLQGCMTENLNHARHIETEIHTFTGIYMAVVAGVLAFNFTGRDGSSVAAAVYIVMIAGGVLARLLLHRWYGAFDTHMSYAERAYYLLEGLTLGVLSFQDVKDRWNDPVENLKTIMPNDPSFAFHHKINHSSLRTRWLVVGFHYAIIIVLVIILVKDIFF